MRFHPTFSLFNWSLKHILGILVVHFQYMIISTATALSLCTTSSWYAFAFRFAIWISCSLHRLDWHSSWQLSVPCWQTHSLKLCESCDFMVVSLVSGACHPMTVKTKCVLFGSCWRQDLPQAICRLAELSLFKSKTVFFLLQMLMVHSIWQIYKPLVVLITASWIGRSECPSSQDTFPALRNHFSMLGRLVKLWQCMSVMYRQTWHRLWKRHAQVSCCLNKGENETWCDVVTCICHGPTPPRNQHVTGSSFSNLSGTALYREALSKGMEILGEEQPLMVFVSAFNIFVLAIRMILKTCLMVVHHAAQVSFHSCCAGARWGAIPIWFQQWHSCSIHCDGVSL